jgi:SAM-dependent methyltransferase
MTDMPRPDWNDVVQKIKAYFAPVAIVSAMKLDIFTPLGEGTKTAQALADSLGLPTRRLRMLLYSLASTGLITHTGDRFENSALANDLVAAAGLTSRIRAVGHDITEAPLAELHDAAVVRNFFQVLTPDAARRAAANAGRSVRPDGQVFIIGLVLDDDRGGPAGALGMNLFFLNAFSDGEAYTESEYREWLEAAGFTDITRAPFAGFDHSLITARKQS